MDTRLEAVSVKALIDLSDKTEEHSAVLEEDLDTSREFGSWRCRHGARNWQAASVRVRTHTVSSPAVSWEFGGRMLNTKGKNQREIENKTTRKAAIGKGQVGTIRPATTTHLYSTMSYRTLPDLSTRPKHQSFSGLYGKPLLYTSRKSRMIKTVQCHIPTFVPFHMELTAAFGLSQSPSLPF